MFGLGKSGKIEQATAQAYESVDAICHPFIVNDSLVGTIKDDPYVAGYMAGRIACAVVLAAKEQGLQMEDAVQIVRLVQVKLYEMSALEVVQLNNELAASKDPEYTRGFQRSQKLQAYALHQKDIVSDPDFLEAMEVAKELGLPQSNDMSVPMAGLEHLWFTTHMDRYL